MVVAEPAVPGAAIWTERLPAAIGGAAAAGDFEKGRIAYVANGKFLFEDLPFNPTTFLSDGEDASWLADATYSGALLNFAYNGCTTIVLPPPDAPTNLEGRAKRLKVNLTWTVSPAADNYLVFRRLNTEVNFLEIGQSTIDVFVDNLPAGTTSAEYFVVAENGNGQSDPSSTITVMPSSRR